MNNVNKQAFIISAELSTLSKAENKDRTASLIKLLHSLRLPFKIADGMYEGVAEQSLYIVAENTYNSVIKNIANEYEQHSYMRIYSDGHAELVYVNAANKGEVQSIGVFTKVFSKDNLKAYTIIAGVIYTCL